jgi:hypothetical protein
MNDDTKIRFYSNIEIDSNTNCWNWASGLWNGYGSFYFQNKRYKAHRFSFLIAQGFEPNVCRHKCDNRKCVNPDHLENGTYKDNTRDMMQRGRWRNQHIDKTHCINGHELSEENISRSGNKRTCRMCSKTRQHTFKQKKRLLQFGDA